MRISNYPNDELTGTEIILGTNVDVSTQKYKTVNFTVDQVKTFVLGPDGGGNQVVFEGTQADQYETILTTIEPTTDNTINLPNISGTIGVFANASYAVGNELITATPAEVNYLDLAVLGTSEMSKVVTADAAGDIKIKGEGTNTDIIWDRSEATLTYESGVKIAGSPTFIGTIGAPLKIGGNLELENDSGDLIFEVDNNATNAANFKINVGAGNRRTDLVSENDLSGTLVSTTISLKDQRVGILQTNPAYTLDVNGNLKCGGIDAGVDNEKIRLGNDNDVEIYHNGSTYIDSGQLNTYIKGGNLYLDINPSGGSSVIYLQADGDSFGYIARDNASPTTSDLEFKVTTSDADMVFKGNDGGSTVTALALDMSAAGYATFNSGISANGDLVLADSGDDLKITIDNNAANSTQLDIISGTGNARIDFSLDGAGALMSLKGQRVGILRTNPDYTLDINGNLGVTEINTRKIVGGDLELEHNSGDLKFSIDNNASSAAALDIVSGAGNARIDFVLPDTAGSALLTLKGQKVGIMQTTPTATLDVSGDIKATQFKQAALDTEPGASSTGTVGDIKISDTHIYVCTAANTWKRAALTGGY